MINIKLIAAIGEDNSIGISGKLCWNIPEDLQNFKELTTGGVVIMGRKTWESLPVKPLPNRRNIVITRNPNYVADGAETYNSIEEALCALMDEKIKVVYIIGGGEIYQQSLKWATNIHLTRVYQNCPEADTFFPEIDKNEWSLFSFSDPEKSTSGVEYSYETWMRVDFKK